MHPGFFGWWKAQQHHGGRCGPAHAGCVGGDGPSERVPERGGHAWHASHFDDGPHFGVRRPLRFMAYKLDLSRDQIAQLAVILNDIKTERAQAAVDARRRLSLIAEALDGDSIDSAKLSAARDLELSAAARVEDAVRSTLERTHALLDAEQRKKLAYLLRTGALTI